VISVANLHGKQTGLISDVAGLEWQSRRRRPIRVESKMASGVLLAMARTVGSVVGVEIADRGVGFGLEPR
jgi:hypothetical protein